MSRKWKAPYRDANYEPGLAGKIRRQTAAIGRRKMANQRKHNANAALGHARAITKALNDPAQRAQREAAIAKYTFNPSENSTSTDRANEASDPCGATRLVWKSDSDSNALVSNPASSTAKSPCVEGGQMAMVEKQ